MPRETKAAKFARTTEIIGRLRQAYPNAHCELGFSNPLELLIATILSAQCTDKQVNLVTADLFRKYRTTADFADADPEQFAQDIRRIGLFRNKAKNIQATCRMLIERHGGEVPRTLPALTALTALAGLAGNGTWHLNLADLAPGGEMTLQSSNLELVGEPVPEPEAVAAIAGLALLGWGTWRRLPGH